MFCASWNVPGSCEVLRKLEIRLAGLPWASFKVLQFKCMCVPPHSLIRINASSSLISWCTFLHSQASAPLTLAIPLDWDGWANVNHYMGSGCFAQLHAAGGGKLVLESKTFTFLKRQDSPFLVTGTVWLVPPTTGI